MEFRRVPADNGVAATECPGGFDPVGDYCYDVLARDSNPDSNVPRRLDWNQAMEYCLSVGGHLGYLEDPEETLLLRLYLTAASLDGFQCTAGEVHGGRSFD
ncbi:unnamed protein product, partial [Cyprideis torosa]